MTKNKKGSETSKIKNTKSETKAEKVDLKKTVSKNQKTRERKVKEIKQEALELAEAIKDFEEDLIEEEPTETKEQTNEETKLQKKPKSLFSYIVKGISWLAMTILGIIGISLVAYVIINKTAQVKGQTPPLGLYTIISPSMTPNIQVYDVVFVAKASPENIQIGDVISYYSTKSYFQEKGIPITHRVIEKYSTSDGIVFRTQGDANPVPDDEVIIGNNVVGVVKFVIPQLGRIQFFLASKAGWIIAILTPALGVLIYDVLKLFKLLKARREMQEVRKALSK